MPMKLIWLAGFLALYLVVCLCIAIYCARRANETSSSILSVIGFSSLAFAGWLVIGYPAGIYSNGLAFGTTAFAPLVMGFAAAMFYERLNWLSRHYKLETPGELFAQYFHSELVRVPIALVALASAVPFLVAVFKASGELLYLLTEESLPSVYGAYVSAAIVLVFTFLGGRCALTRLGFLQTLLLALASYLLAYKALGLIGGMEAFGEVFKALLASSGENGANTVAAYLSMPSAGNTWVLPRTLSALFAYTGVIVGPAFLLWAINASSTAELRGQYVIGLAGVLSIVLLTAMTIIGFAGHLLGANLDLYETAPDAVYNVLAAGLGAGDITEHELGTRALVPLIINVFGQTGDMAEAALSGFLGIALLAAMHASAAAVLYLSSVVVSSDGVMTSPNKSGTRIVMVLMIIIVACALFLDGTWTEDAGDIALAVGCLMWPALVALCFVRWFTAPALICGLIAGAAAIAVVLNLKSQLVHPVVAGLAANFLAVAIVSVFTQSGTDHRARFHQELAVRTSSRSEIFIMVIVMLVWAFLAFGPGANLAESFYGNWAVPQTWTFGLLPSLWVWQLCWWFIGMFVLYCAARVFCVRREDA